MEITILQNCESGDLTNEINSYLSTGWELLGELKVVPLNSNAHYLCKYVQMMKRDKQEEN